MTQSAVESAGRRYLCAIHEASKVWRRVDTAMGNRPFVTEVSFDEGDEAQKPVELAVILAGLAQEGVPICTIAPRFPGQFLKGVDYVGDIEVFHDAFESFLAVVEWAVQQFGLPMDLKLSIHSGSDKFALYSVIRESTLRFDTGLHVKTAGTTWLEEVIGLAEADGDGLNLAREIYVAAYSRIDELTEPYKGLVVIAPNRLPPAANVEQWTSGQFVQTLRHDARNPRYNPHFRQLLHVAYKVAAEMGECYLGTLRSHADVVGTNVTLNLLDRHIRPLFMGPRKDEHNMKTRLSHFPGATVNKPMKEFKHG